MRQGLQEGPPQRGVHDVAQHLGRHKGCQARRGIEVHRTRIQQICGVRADPEHQGRRHTIRLVMLPVQLRRDVCKVGGHDAGGTAERRVLLLEQRLGPRRGMMIDVRNQGDLRLVRHGQGHVLAIDHRISRVPDPRKALRHLMKRDVQKMYERQIVRTADHLERQDVHAGAHGAGHQRQRPSRRQTIGVR